MVCALWTRCAGCVYWRVWSPSWIWVWLQRRGSHSPVELKVLFGEDILDLVPEVPGGRRTVRHIHIQISVPTPYLRFPEDIWAYPTPCSRPSLALTLFSWEAPSRRSAAACTGTQDSPGGRGSSPVQVHKVLPD